MSAERAQVIGRWTSIERIGNADFEVAKVRLPQDAGRNAVRKLLTDEAEYGGWELMRLRRYRNGVRDAWLRRRIIRQRATMLSGVGEA